MPTIGVLGNLSCERCRDRIAPSDPIPSDMCARAKKTTSGKAILKNGLLTTPRTDAIRIGSSRWREWLADHSTFVFEGGAGHFTAQRELRRGCAFWYAYRRREGKLCKAYLGKSEDLNEAVFEQASAHLSGRTRGVVHPTHLNATMHHVATSRASDYDNAAHPDDAMSFLLLTKVRPPALPEKLIVRTRLTERMNAPVTVICAPSGSGKSTLLNAWRQTCDMPVAWVSLDADDSPPQRFWSTLAAALRMAHPCLRDSLHAECRATTPTAIQEFVCDVLNKIVQASEDTSVSAEGCGFARIGLVLDDFHHVQHAEALAAVQFMLDHLPAALQVVIASNTRPMLALGQLRAQGALSELMADDLRFTQDEGVAFLAQHNPGLPLAESDLHLLIARTEGWAAGLTLATLALSQSGERRNFLETFTGAHIFLREYFVERVFHQQPQTVKTFLLKTAMLKHLTGPLCDAVTGRADGTEMLAHLWQDNLFLVRSEERGWYRYHDLFAEMLCSQLPLHFANEVDELHRRAAQWYCQHQSPADAIHHLLRIEAWEEAAALIEDMALRELAQFGEDSRLLRWLQQLPEAVVQHHKTLLFVYVSLAMSALPRIEVGQFLARIETNINKKTVRAQTKDEREVVAEIRQIRRAWASESSAHAPILFGRGHDVIWHMLNRQAYAALVMRWRPDEASAMFHTLYKTAQSQQHLFILLMSGGTYATTLVAQGSLRQAEQQAHQVLQEAQTLRRSLPEPASIPLVALSEVYYERNQLAQANQYLQRAEAADPNPASSNMKIRIAMQRARIQIAQGACDAARTTIQAAHELHARHPSGLWLDQDLVAYEALACLRQGDTASAAQLLNGYCEPGAEFHALSAVVQAELFLAQAQFATAETLLQKLVATFPHGFLFESILGARVMLAGAFFEQRKRQLAQQQICEALQLAAPEMFVRPFLDHGQRVAPLLAWLLQGDELAAETQRFTKDILRMTGNVKALLHEEVEKWSAAVSISTREQDVLRLLCAGLSNHAIAEKFCISDHTVKTHLVNLYRKLGVKNRTQAMARAQGLGLLS